MGDATADDRFRSLRADCVAGGPTSGLTRLFLRPSAVPNECAPKSCQGENAVRRRKSVGSVGVASRSDAATPRAARGPARSHPFRLAGSGEHARARVPGQRGDGSLGSRRNRSPPPSSQTAPTLDPPFRRLLVPCLQQRRAMIASAPATVKCMPERLHRVPMAVLHPDSTTPVEVHSPAARNSA